MSIPEIDFSQAIDADAQLQQELRDMFAVDTQSYLQRYGQIAENLQMPAWRSDIQELYRCIHTIKGGAVTVGAEAALQAASALEDVLSDLRYLEPAPQLTDAHLSHLLLECGELLSVALKFQQHQDIEPILNRIQALRQEIQERYLPDWDQFKLLQQEFAEQGVDLVVLELEIALERLPAQGQVSASTLQIAQNALEQLRQVGQELQFAAPWKELLDQAQTLFIHPSNAVWRSQWLHLFQALKTCAKQGGESIAFEFANFDSLEREAAQVEAAQAAEAAQVEAPLDSDDFLSTWLDTLTPLEDLSLFDLAADHLAADYLAADHLNTVDLASNDFTTIDLAAIDFTSDDVVPIDQVDLTDLTQTNLTHQEPSSLIESAPNRPSSEMLERVKIPVSLKKLDQSAQSLVETLLSLQTAQGFYQTLQSQVTQLVTLAQEGAQYITHLRQIQDDYALLDRLRPTQSEGPTPERYRQGYSIINRLLETSLRLSEIGAETGKTSQQVALSFQQIERNAAKLQTTIEESRLVPFQNLVFQAKTILRELTTRYGKPAQLLVQGEQTELDVSIVRELEPALLHLIRNAYDHGLESADERIAEGKPEHGTLTLSLQRQGNSFQLQIQDDGRGINAPAVQARAEALGLPLTQTQTTASLLAVICQPGFSSQTQVSEVSGRGMGMDVVAAQVARLNGRLEIQTTLGAGTTFQLKFPMPRLLVPCVLLQAGDHTLAIPNEDIKTIALFSNLQPRQSVDQTQDQTQDQTRWQVDDEAGSTPVLDILHYWQPQLMNRAIADTAICLYISTAAETTPGVWLLADELLEQSELIINPLPAPLIAPSGLIGVSLQKTGGLTPVLEAQPLVERLLAPLVALPEPVDLDTTLPDLESDAIVPSILIVDDAALMRRRIEASLNAYGYLTHNCVDGLDAWNWLQTHPRPRLIITDIEMPNMDGFTLIDRCRSQGITIPILVVSSRLLEEWADEARRLGATDYLTKGFSTIELIKKVDSLLSLQKG